jgi:hypothetical protein
METSPARFNSHQDQKHRWRYQPEACWIFLLSGGSHSTLHRSSSPLDGARAPHYSLVRGMVLLWCRGEELALSGVCLGCCFVFTFCLLLCLVRQFVAFLIVCYLTLLFVACLPVCGLLLLFDVCLLLVTCCLFVLLTICNLSSLLVICICRSASERSLYWTHVESVANANTLPLS